MSEKLWGAFFREELADIDGLGVIGNKVADLEAREGKEVGEENLGGLNLEVKVFQDLMDLQNVCETGGWLEGITMDRGWHWLIWISLG